VLRLDFTDFTIGDFSQFLEYVRNNDYLATANTLAKIVVEWDEPTDPNLPESYRSVGFEYYASVLVAVQEQITGFLGEVEDDDSDDDIVVDLGGWVMEDFHNYVNAAQEGDYARLGELVQKVVSPWPYEDVAPLDLLLLQFRLILKAVNAKTAASFRTG